MTTLGPIEAAPFLDVPIDQIMTPRPATVGPDDSLGHAAGVMVEGGFRHLPVVDVDDIVVGVLSERDLRARLGTELERFADAARDLLAEEVGGVMRPDPVTLPSDSTVRDALEILADERVGALPVVDGDRLVGIVSYLDVLAYLLREAPRPTPPRDSPHAAPKRRPVRPRRRAGAAARRGRRTSH